MNVKKIEHIIKLMEEYDMKMAEHSERTAMLCYAFAKELKLDAEYLEIAYISGLLHDIGRVGYNKFIEIGDIKIDIEMIYPYFSQAIIGKIEGFEDVAKVVIQNSENYDGSGPLKLSGEDIGTIATILRISDYYDTQRSKGFSHDETTKMLRENSDIIFPRKIITPFIKSVINNDLQFEYYGDDINE